MTKLEAPDYGGIFLDAHDIRYEKIDPPLRSLIRLINSKPWSRTYGCCAGYAHHGEDPGDEHQFFIGLFVKADCGGIRRLRSWVDEANRINGPTGLRAEVESVHKHPFGQDRVEGWSAYRLVLHEIRKGRIFRRPQTYLRMIRSFEEAYDRLWPATDN